MEVAGKRALVMGLGCHGGGVAVAHFLACAGAQVVITDLVGEHRLAASIEQLRDVPVAGYRLGEHCRQDFLAADLVVVNPAVRPEHPYVELARQNGATITSEVELFLERCPAPVIGVTGTMGKSTTAAMIAAMLEADGQRAFLGGNIGRSLLGDLDTLDSEDVVVLELSSFQLAHLGSAVRMPTIAVITNCSPHHLDWHGSYSGYKVAKQRLLRGQQPTDAVVLNSYDGEVAAWRRLARGRIVTPWPENEVPPLRVIGPHNRANAACAMAAASTAGCSLHAMRTALSTFRGLSHRFEAIAKIERRYFINDSKATTPDASIAAVSACNRPCWLLAGGYDKGANFSLWAKRIAPRVHGVALFGAARHAIHTQLCEAAPRLEVTTTERMADALDWCWQHSSSGDAILLSPGCASYDQFDDFEHRGREFTLLVNELRALSMVG